MFKDIDFNSIEKTPFDGATLLGSRYVPPSIPDFEGEVEEGLKVYKGNCHCGAITYALKSKPLEDIEVMSCNCSLCSRVCNITKSALVFLTNIAEERFLDLPALQLGAGSRP